MFEIKCYRTLTTLASLKSETYVTFCTLIMKFSSTLFLKKNVNYNFRQFMHNSFHIVKTLTKSIMIVVKFFQFIPIIDTANFEARIKYVSSDPLIEKTKTT